jgi:hypothetical protein
MDGKTDGMEDNSASAGPRRVSLPESKSAGSLVDMQQQQQQKTVPASTRRMPSESHSQSLLQSAGIQRPSSAAPGPVASAAYRQEHAQSSTSSTGILSTGGNDANKASSIPIQVQRPALSHTHADSTDSENRTSSSDLLAPRGSRMRSSTQRIARLREPDDPRALLRIQHGVIKGRNGSVLGRGFILKNDRLPPRNTHPLEFSLKGAPNFRSAGEENIYGSAQPSITGIRTVLSALGCQPGTNGKVVWICTREEPVIYIGGSPFVLRDAETPLVGYSLSDRPEALESIERRLKNDILREAQRYGGVVQVQEEVAASLSSAPQISAQWIAASPSNVMTIRELWQSLQEEGFNVEYHRIAISSDENPENQYLDHFLDVVRNVNPETALYFNDGVGVVRATFAMTMALLVRRHKVSLAASQTGQRKTHSKSTSVIDMNVQRHLLAEANAITKRNRSLIRLTAVLNNCIPQDNQLSVMNGLLALPQVLENLRMAVEGEYDIILNLLSCLEMGEVAKGLADAAIDQCDAVINLREDILNHRINFAMAAMDEENRDLHYRKGAAGLERYFFLIAFASFIAETENKPDMKYSTWLGVSSDCFIGCAGDSLTFCFGCQARAELRNMVGKMRKPHKTTWIFGPVADLSSLSKVSQLGATTPLAQSRFSDVLREGGEVIADEFAGQLVRRRRGVTLRAGMILKVNDRLPKHSFNSF